MAYKWTDKGHYAHEDGFACVYKFICDTEADVAKLQTEHPNCGAGSTALVVETGNVYMVNASGNWVKFGG